MLPQQIEEKALHQAAITCSIGSQPHFPTDDILSSPHSIKHTIPLSSSSLTGDNFSNFTEKKEDLKKGILPRPQLSLVTNIIIFIPPGKRWETDMGDSASPPSKTLYAVRINSLI